MSIPYMVMLQLTEGRIVAVAHNNQVTLFTGEGAFQVPWEPHFVFPSDPTNNRAKFWLFLDFDCEKTPPPPHLYLDGFTVFPIHVTSPTEPRLYRFVKDMKATIRVMNPWPLGELRIGYAECLIACDDVHEFFVVGS